jgi:hypothetical protein
MPWMIGFPIGEIIILEADEAEFIPDTGNIYNASVIRLKFWEEEISE